MQDAGDLPDRHDPSLVDLTALDPIAAGHSRDVYARPGRPDLLLKRTRSHRDGVWRRRTGLLSRLKRCRPVGPYKMFLKEYRTYIAVANRADRLGRPIPIAEFGGVVRTESGLAQVVERITDGHGGLARTLGAICRSGAFDARMLEQLNVFVADVYALNVVAPDLNHVNIVHCGAGPGSGPDCRFILVDGYGDKAMLPVRTWLPWLNMRTLDRQFARLGRTNPLLWSLKVRRFSLRTPQ